MRKENHSLFFLSAVSDAAGTLTNDEYRHAFRALRIAPDGALYATDGKGNIYKCKLAPRSGETGEVDIVETARQPPFLPPVRVFIGLPEREPFEAALAALSALGAAAIIPVIGRYCQEQWWRPWEKRGERLRRIMIAGIKQAHNPWLPDLRAPQPLDEALSTLGAEPALRPLRLVADCDADALTAVLRRTEGIDRVDCFIGPPGGFSPDELDLLRPEIFKRVGLSPFRLRTELAAIVSCAQIMQHFTETSGRRIYLISNSSDRQK